MIYGTVEYGFKEGGGEGKDWAARALLVSNGSKGASGDLGGWKMKFYQVYLVSACCCWLFVDFQRTRWLIWRSIQDTAAKK